MKYKEVEKIRDESYKRGIYLSVFLFAVFIVTSFSYKIFASNSQYITDYDYFIALLSSAVAAFIVFLIAILYLILKYLCPKCHGRWTYRAVNEIVVDIVTKRIRMPYSNREFVYKIQKCIVEFECCNCLHINSVLKTYRSREI